MTVKRRSALDFLPVDAAKALLVGRVWSAAAAGPLPVLLRGRDLLDLSPLAVTVSGLLELPDLVARLRHFNGVTLGRIEDILGEPDWALKAGALRLLAPIDLQCIKACGVTFAVSAMERIVEEQAKGSAVAAERIRGELKTAFGEALMKVRPGTADALAIKEQLIERGLWSQYLEVAIGPDAEVFTKAPVLSAVGFGDFIGIRGDSDWNNPEPEVVLICNSRAAILGATLGNDVNLRDFEGRSALLLGKGKDNNASASLGPFIRLFDDDFSLASVRDSSVLMTISGLDGFTLHSESSMTLISRDPEDLVAQTCGADHQYPDGFALYLGSLFAPTQDRGAAGMGFTHAVGDVVEISSPRFGCLANKVALTTAAPPWKFGVGALLDCLVERRLKQA